MLAFCTCQSSFSLPTEVLQSIPGDFDTKQWAKGPSQASRLLNRLPCRAWICTPKDGPGHLLPFFANTTGFLLLELLLEPSVHLRAALEETQLSAGGLLTEKGPLRG